MVLVPSVTTSFGDSPVVSSWIDNEPLLPLVLMVVFAFDPGQNSVDERGGIAPISTFVPPSFVLPVLRMEAEALVHLFLNPERSEAMSSGER